MKRKSILLVDDEPVILASLRRELASDNLAFVVTLASSGEEAIAKINDDCFDLVVTDLLMSGLDGLHVLKAAKQKDAQTMVIILTGYGDMKVTIDALRLGVDDFLQKPCDADELLYRMSNCFVKQDLQRKVNMYESYDFLTGLPNRALLADRLKQSIAFAQRDGKKVGLMYLDLDHFKHINDSLGHAVGDQLLQSVAKRLQSCVRLSDTISRHGGDEFVVVLPGIEDAHDAVRTAEKIIAAIAQPHLINGYQLCVTISIGISIYPDDGESIENVVRKADTAMYQAKEMGRNSYQVFTREMNIRAVARQSIEQALHRALEQHNFVLHYQPKVNLATGAITGVEALVRMQEPGSRLVCPTQFISIAEECGLILPIGRWVLYEACRQAQVWLQAGHYIGQIAVNVSSLEFHHKDFLAGVISILEDTGLDPRYLELEMTESGLMRDTEPTTAILYALKKLGVRIAIDDFGTGYSSLSYMLRFPIDTLKIDQSFVQDLDGVITGDTGVAGKAIVSSIIEMGASLKKRVVAEGVEARQQLTFLQAHHCTEGQGYYFSRPVPAEEFTSLLETGLSHPPSLPSSL